MTSPMPRALPRGIVHRVMDRPQRGRQRQVEQVEKRGPVMRIDATTRRFCRGFARRLIGVDAEAERRTQQGADRIAPLAGAEIENQAPMAGKAAPCCDGRERQVC